MAGQVLPGDLVLALPFGEPDQVQAAGVNVVADVGGNCSVIGRISAEDTNWFPRWWQKNPWMPCPYCSRGWRKVSSTRSMQRISSVT